MIEIKKGTVIFSFLFFLVTGSFFQISASGIEDKCLVISDWAKEIIESFQSDMGDMGFINNDYTQNIRRDEYSELIYVVLQKTAEDLKMDQCIKSAFSPFKDTDSPVIGSLYAAGIIKGRDADYFEPGAPITREEAATIAWRMMKYFNVHTFKHTIQDYSDRMNISSWAASAVDELSFYRILLGTGNHCFSPSANITKEAAIAIMVRMMETIKEKELTSDYHPSAFANIPEGYHLKRNRSLYWVEDQNHTILYWLPGECSERLGKDNEWYDFLQVCKINDRVILCAYGINHRNLYQQSRTNLWDSYGINFLDFYTGQSQFFIEGVNTDIVEVNNKKECFIIRRMNPDNYDQLVGGYQGALQYIYGVYNLNGDELIPISHTWNDLKIAGYVDKENEPEQALTGSIKKIPIM